MLINQHFLRRKRYVHLGDLCDDWKMGKKMKARCGVCFRKCMLEEGEVGPCLARKNRGGMIGPENYGMVTSLALDPIEKKPLSRFHPGSRILSLGSFGCNLFCPFCQNHEIAHPDSVNFLEYRSMVPEEIVSLALDLKSRGNIGCAFTYNEPLVGWEFVRDTAKLVKQEGMVNVLVSNGTASEAVLTELSPYIDAMNIDLKAFSDGYYREYVKGDFGMTKHFIEKAVSFCHVELTMLVLPGKNDSEEEMRALSGWVAGLADGKGREIPLHISRYFPRYREKLPPTDVSRVYRLVEVAKERLAYVYPGNC